MLQHQFTSVVWGSRISCYMQMWKQINRGKRDTYLERGESLVDVEPDYLQGLVGSLGEAKAQQQSVVHSKKRDQHQGRLKPLSGRRRRNDWGIFQNNKLESFSLIWNYEPLMLYEWITYRKVKMYKILLVTRCQSR